MRFQRIRRMRTERPRFFWCAICALGAFLGFWAAFGLYAVYLDMMGNFHTVVAGEFYRSSQPSREQIAHYKKEYGIQTIINLRGDNTGSPWYDEEVEASQQLGITYINFRMSARRDLSQDRAKELVAHFQQAPKPILVHCARGADRSGIASALFLAAVAKKSEEESEAQISMRFGHVPIPYLSSAYAMDRSFENLETWLGYDGS